MGLGSLLFALPHFTTDLYLTNSVSVNETQIEEEENLCIPGRIIKQKEEETESLIQNLQNYKYVFVFGQILHGIGAAPLITLGTTLLDESVAKNSAPMYIGIFQTFFVVGPALGYLLGGFFLSIYTDFDTGIQIENLNPASPLWVGAWWIGFLISFMLSWFCALFLSSYPSSIPQKVVKKEDTNGHPDSIIGNWPLTTIVSKLTARC